MRVLLAVLTAVLCGAAHAESKIYSCVDAAGHPLIRDRPIPECAAGRDLVEKRPDGSTRGVVRKPPTDDERAAAEEAERKRKEAEAAERARTLEERSLLRHFPDKAAHDRERERALEPARSAMRISERRQQDLREERRHLADEEEFYPGKPLPPKLRAAIDANEAAQRAQEEAMAAQRAELERINAHFDEESVRLEALRRATTTATSR
jgi:hypothetical protein